MDTKLKTTRGFNRLSRTALGLGLGLGALAATAAEIEGLRVWADPQKTRAVFDLDGAVDYRVFTLPAPDRVVIDVTAAALGIADLTLPADTPHGVLRAVRHGRQENGSLRLVFDLSAAARVKSFLLPPAADYGHRLVIDLEPAAGAAQTPVVLTASAARGADHREVLIAVDAGHGGEDPGAIGPSRTREKDVTLAMARELKRQIDAEPGMRAVLIRDGDYYVALRERHEIARRARADLFVSIHADGFRDARARGSSVYVLSTNGASSEAAKMIADRENMSDLVGGVSFEGRDETIVKVLLDMSQNATMQASRIVAGNVLEALAATGRTHKAHVEAAGFVVLKSPDVPSILVESAFITNPEEERKLRDPAAQKRLAGAILSGIGAYFRQRPPPGTWLAANRAAARHVVGRGDTLSGIAARYQIPVDRIREANRLDGDVIQLGAVLMIPSG